jgi:hypothetical protein
MSSRSLHIGRRTSSDSVGRLAEQDRSIERVSSDWPVLPSAPATSAKSPHAFAVTLALLTAASRRGIRRRSNVGMRMRPCARGDSEQMEDR